MQEAISLQELLRVGAHFGHQASKWHPRMKPFLFAKRDSIHIIDLRKTAEGLERALAFVAKQAAAGKNLLFVGTKRQARESVKKAALDAGMPFMTERWIGGLLTNFPTMHGRIQRLRELRSMFETRDVEKYTKKERLVLQDEMIRLERSFGGVSKLDKLPDALFIIDLKADRLAMHEAKRMGIPVVALADSNVDPTVADYPIPSNDDAVKVIEYMSEKVSATVKENFKAPAGSVKAVAPDLSSAPTLVKKEKKDTPTTMNTTEKKDEAAA